jgi:hypothetical protein
MATLNAPWSTITPPASKRATRLADVGTLMGIRACAMRLSNEDFSAIKA